MRTKKGQEFLVGTRSSIVLELEAAKSTSLQGYQSKPFETEVERARDNGNAVADMRRNAGMGVTGTAGSQHVLGEHHLHDRASISCLNGEHHLHVMSSWRYYLYEGCSRSGWHVACAWGSSSSSSGFRAYAWGSSSSNLAF